MSTYLELLSNTFKSDSKQSFAFNALLEKGKQVFGNAEEFSLWLENSYSNSYQKSIDFIMDEIDRLAQGYCV